MVSIYSLKPVYTFLYTIINCNVIASFVQKKKSFEILWSKKNFLCVHTQPWNSPPSLYTIVHIWLDPSPPSLCVRTMWITFIGPIPQTDWPGIVVIRAPFERQKVVVHNFDRTSLSGFATWEFTAKEDVNPEKQVFLRNLRISPGQKPKIWSIFYAKSLDYKILYCKS